MAIKFTMSHADFVKLAGPMILKLGNQDFVAAPRQFNSGSLGWYANGKLALVVGQGENAQAVTVQVGLTMTVVGSKPADRPNLNEVRLANGKAPIELDATGHAPAPKAPSIKKSKKGDTTPAQ